MSRGAVMNGAPLAAHAFTALPIAAARAVAHERSGAQVEDPLARKLLLGAGGEKGKQLLQMAHTVLARSAIGASLLIRDRRT